MKIYIIEALTYSDRRFLGVADSQDKADDYISELKSEDVLPDYTYNVVVGETEDVDNMLAGMKRWRVSGKIGGALHADRTVDAEPPIGEAHISRVSAGGSAWLHGEVHVIARTKIAACNHARDIFRLYTKPEERRAWTKRKKERKEE